MTAEHPQRPPVEVSRWRVDLGNGRVAWIEAPTPLSIFEVEKIRGVVESLRWVP